MSNDWDPELSRVFARAAREPLVDDLFRVTLLQTVDRVRRLRLWRQIFVAAAVVLIVAVNLRLVLEETADAVRWVADAAPTYAEWAASMLIGAWVVLRARRSRG